MKDPTRPCAGAAPVLMAVVLLSAVFPVSCGKVSGLFGKQSPESASGKALDSTPGPADASGWFDASGPDNLSAALEWSPGTGLTGVRDLLPAGTDFYALDVSGLVLRISPDAAWIVERFPAEDVPASPAVALAAGKDAIFLSREDGTVRAIVLVGGQGSEPAVKPASWSASPGFTSDWLLGSETGHVICVSSEGKISALSMADGSTQSFLDLGTPPAGKPVVTGSTLLVSKDKGISAFDIPALRFLWTRDIAPAKGQTIWTSHGVAAFEDAEGIFRVLDAASGKDRYSLSTGGNVQAACDGRRLYLAGSDGSLGAYNLSDGVPVWTAGAFAGPENSPVILARFSPRLAVSRDRVYLAAPGKLEAWDSETGELLDQALLPGRADGISILSVTLLVRMRGGSLYRFGAAPDVPEGLDLEAPARPVPEAARRIASSLGKYSDPGKDLPPIAWRVHVPEAALASDTGFTVFRYDASEAGKRVFTISPPDAEGVLMAVYDSNGEERHVNVGELGVDRSFEQWLEPGVWYVALGRLRGSEGTEPVFLDIR